MSIFRKWASSHRPEDRRPRDGSSGASGESDGCGSSPLDNVDAAYPGDRDPSFIASWLDRSTNHHLSLGFMAPTHFERCQQIQQDEFSRAGWVILNNDQLRELLIRPQVTAMVAKISGWTPNPFVGGVTQERVVGWMAGMMVVPAPCPQEPDCPLPESMLYLFRLCISRDLPSDTFLNVARLMVSNVVGSARVMGLDKVRVPMGWWQTDLIKVLQEFRFVHDRTTVTVRATTTQGGTSFEETTDGEVFVFVLDTRETPTAPTAGGSA